MVEKHWGKCSGNCRLIKRFEPYLLIPQIRTDEKETDGEMQHNNTINLIFEKNGDKANQRVIEVFNFHIVAYLSDYCL